MENLEMPKLSYEKATKIDAPITAEKIEKAVKRLLLGKAPGEDGYTAGFYYKSFPSSPLPFMVELFNDILGTGVAPDSSSRALITVIPKNVDPTAPIVIKQTPRFTQGYSRKDLKYSCRQ